MQRTWRYWAQAKCRRERIFYRPQGRYSYSQIADRAVLTDGELTASELNEQWWQSVWQGQLSSDSLEPLRQGYCVSSPRSL